MNWFVFDSYRPFSHFDFKRYDEIYKNYTENPSSLPAGIQIIKNKDCKPVLEYEIVKSSLNLKQKSLTNFF